MCDPLCVVSLGVYKKVCSALKAGAIFLPLKSSLIPCSFSFNPIAIILFQRALNLILYE